MRPALGILLALAACAATPPTLSEPPVELTGGNLLAPLAVIADAAARDWDRAGTTLEGQPQATALAAARLEWLAGEGRPGGRLAAYPASFRFGLDRARDEVRANLAIAPDATPEQTVAALLAARRALAANDAAAVQASLSPPAFRDVQPSPLRRLSEPGVSPSAQIATAALREEVARVAAERGGPLFDAPGRGLTTFGMGGSTDR
ncbi:MAG: hypothetical protein K2X11_00895 [Acetobacteraceae bacterium]|nr:hypothetical protein [Acetobacteraceae bacterium]